MTTITIPKHLAGKDLVLVVKEDYEALEERARFSPPAHYMTVQMTKGEKKALEKARKNFASGNTLSIDEFRRKLGIKN